MENGNVPRRHNCTRATVFKSAFVPLHGAKSDLPKSHRILRDPGSNERSRSPLSIGALRVARGDRITVVTIFASKNCFIFPAQSRPLARLVQDDGSRKLPQITPATTYLSLEAQTEPTCVQSRSTQPPDTSRHFVPSVPVPRSL